MGFPFETKVLCKLLFVMFLLILAYRLTTSLHHSQQHVDTVSTGALNTRERELEAGCCPTKQHLATARLASPCADMTQLNISSFDESASVFSLTPRSLRIQSCRCFWAPAFPSSRLLSDGENALAIRLFLRAATLPPVFNIS